MISTKTLLKNYTRIENHFNSMTLLSLCLVLNLYQYEYYLYPRGLT